MIKVTSLSDFGLIKDHHKRSIVKSGATTTTIVGGVNLTAAIYRIIVITTTGGILLVTTLTVLAVLFSRTMPSVATTTDDDDSIEINLEKPTLAERVYTTNDDTASNFPRPDSIQEILHQSETNHVRKSAGVEAPSKDPFDKFRPRHFSDVNLLAMAKFRFAPPTNLVVQGYLKSLPTVLLHKFRKNLRVLLRIHSFGFAEDLHCSTTSAEKVLSERRFYEKNTNDRHDKFEDESNQNVVVIDLHMLDGKHQLNRCY